MTTQKLPPIGTPVWVRPRFPDGSQAWRLEVVRSFEDPYRPACVARLADALDGLRETT